MQEKIFREIEEIRKSIQKNNPKDIEEFHVKFLGKNGKFSKLFEKFRTLLPDQKKK